jgi:hypothetical protein
MAALALPALYLFIVGPQIQLNELPGASVTFALID